MKWEKYRKLKEEYKKRRKKNNREE